MKTGIKVYLSMVGNHNNYSEEEVMSYINTLSDEDQKIIGMINKLVTKTVEEEIKDANDEMNQYVKAVEDVEAIVSSYIEAIGGSDEEFAMYVANDHKLVTPRKEFVISEGDTIETPITGGVIIKQIYVEK